jgi:prophage regulatory protein
MMPTPFNCDRLVDSKERRQLVPYSDMHIWRMEEAGTFPKRIKLGPNRVAWSLREITEWIECRMAERSKDKKATVFVSEALTSEDRERSS